MKSGFLQSALLARELARGALSTNARVPLKEVFQLIQAILELF